MAKRTEPKEVVVERVRNHTAEQHRRGLKRVSVWIPSLDVERLREIAAQLRRNAGTTLLTDGRSPPQRIEIPTVERSTGAEAVWLKIGADELGLHMLLKANGGAWKGQRKLWEVPAYLPPKLGLTGRVVEP